MLLANLLFSANHVVRNELCSVGGQVPTGVEFHSQSNECSKLTQNIDRQTLVEAPATHMGNLRYQECGSENT